MKKIVGAIALAAVIFTTTVPAHASDVPAEFSGHGARMGQGVPEDYGLASSFPAGRVPGLDVSGYQPNVDWWGERDEGAGFSYNKVSEGNYYTNPHKTNQAQGARTGKPSTGLKPVEPGSVKQKTSATKNSKTPSKEKKSSSLTEKDGFQGSMEA